MTDGDIKRGLSFTENNFDNSNVSDNGFGKIGDSFYRTVTFFASDVLASAGDFTVDAHWTMSCGNDEINARHFQQASIGGNPVPEPSAFALMAIGSLSLGFAGYRRRKLKF